jgi:hypothetical protein
VKWTVGIRDGKLYILHTLRYVTYSSSCKVGINMV